MSDLPSDIEEEVLSRLPVTSLGKLRSICKEWNSLTKKESFIKKKQRKGIEMVVMMILDSKVSLMSVHDLFYPYMERIGNLHAGGVDISSIFPCGGLFLCITKNKDKDSSRLVAWNPYLGQTRWIEPSNSYHKCEKYALGYEKEKRKHKILRLVNEVDGSANQICEFEMYSLNSSSSWKVVTDGFAKDWCMPLRSRQSSSSVKGNTYWYVQEKRPLGGGQISPNFLVCFDFTTERFGPRLPLPFEAFFLDTVILSSVREEKLAVLYQKYRYCVPGPVKMWITNKIEPNAVSWNYLFLADDTTPLFGPSPSYLFHKFYGSFFVDEETKVVVFLIKERHNYSTRNVNVAYIIGRKGYLKKVDLGKSKNLGFCCPFVCSYVPSSVQIPNTP